MAALPVGKSARPAIYLLGDGHPDGILPLRSAAAHGAGSSTTGSHGGRGDVQANVGVAIRSCHAMPPVTLHPAEGDTYQDG